MPRVRCFPSKHPINASCAKNGVTFCVRCVHCSVQGIAAATTLYSSRERPKAHLFATPRSLRGSGGEVEGLQDDALAVVDEAAARELICLGLAD